MTCELCGGDRPEFFLRSQDSDIMKCPGCGFMYREPYSGCAAACAACGDKCIDRLAEPGFLEARLRVDEVEPHAYRERERTPARPPRRRPSRNLCRSA